LNKLKVSVLQLSSIDDISTNIIQVKKLILEALKFNPDLICLPENALYLRIKEGEAIPSLQITDPVFSELQSLIKNQKTMIHIGSVPLRKTDGVYNSSVIVSGEKIEASYNKIHLFDIHLTNQKPIRESDVFKHGESPKVFTVNGWKVAQSICYDLRFSELYSMYAKQEVDLILVPSAFLVPTGKAHWEVLIRARAIESQAFVIAAAQAGQHKSLRTDLVRETYGNSMIVSPWGAILKQGGPNQQEVINYELDLQEIGKTRMQIPMKNHRRV
jgi:predicted amidohydrolase